MAKGAATEQVLGTLHAKIAEVFIKVLARYEQRLVAIDTIDPAEFDSEVLEQLFNEGAMPNPAMLSAVTKFLKDNNIGFDTKEIAELTDQERRLKERRANRGNIASLTTLKVVGD
ncbi:MAG: hypothetical protein ACK5PF_01880 [bacterium]|jgi:3-methyladenine DNA glycosylase AlkD